MPAIPKPGRGRVLTCPWCGFRGAFNAKAWDGLSVMICLLLTFPLPLPGLVYYLWHIQQEECPECRAVVPRGPL